MIPTENIDVPSIKKKNLSRSSFPNALTDKPRWVVWKRSADGRKRPHSVRTLRAVDVTQENAGVTMEEALSAFHHRDGVDGLGFIFNGDGLVGIDLDSCVQDGVVMPEALDIFRVLGCRYVEYSPSGTGLHGIGLYEEVLPAATGVYNGVNVEIYCKSRFFTMTGEVLPEFGEPAVERLQGLGEFVQKLTRVPTQVTKATQDSQASQETHVSQETYAGGAAHASPLVALKFPSFCIPTQFGQRNKVVFNLARFLKSAMSEAPVDQLEPVVRHWFDLHIANIRTKDFDITWMDFLAAWDSVEQPYGAVLQDIIGRPVELPEWMDTSCFPAKAIKLLRICVALADHHHPNPFYLSTRMAGGLLGIDHTDAHKFFKVFKARGLLTVINNGNRRYAPLYALGGPVSTEKKQIGVA